MQELDSSIAWIQLELIPLPTFENELSGLIVWWNPVLGSIVGEGSESILLLVQKAIDQGFLPASKASGMASFEISDPLSKPSELAAILAQYFWVVPTPVKADEVQQTTSIPPSRLQ